MISADHLQVPKTQRNVQRLEESLLERSASFPSLASIAEDLPGIKPPIQCPATPLEYMDSPPPATAPSPEGGSPIIPERDLPTPPPVAGNNGCPFQIWGHIHLLNDQTSHQSDDAVSYRDNESLFGG
jgi:hypothetical protein